MGTRHGEMANARMLECSNIAETQDSIDLESERCRRTTIFACDIRAFEYSSIQHSDSYFS